MKKAFLAIALCVLSPSAFAETWRCEIGGDMAGVKLGFFFGGQVIRGEGEISCSTEGGRESRVPVRLAILGGGVGFDFTIVRQVRIVSEGVGGLRGPADLLGAFSVAASAGTTLIHQGHNVDAAISVKGKGRGLGFEVGMIGEDAVGLGARVHGLAFLVERL